MALKKQMELFDEGGLLDEGGTIDEESGNEVPTGSLKKEVRDDIPAQLSAGINGNGQRGGMPNGR